MTTSKTDIKKNSPAMNNRFLVAMGAVVKVRCMDCWQPCVWIPLPTFSVYFCENPDCGNGLELRYHKNGKFEIREFGAAFKDLEIREPVDKLMME